MPVILSASFGSGETAAEILQRSEGMTGMISTTSLTLVLRLETVHRLI